MVDDLNSLLQRGEAVSIDDLIRSVLKEYTRNKISNESESLERNKKD